jgi:DNA primase
MAGGSNAAQRYHHQLVRERDNDAWVYLTKERGLRPFWIKQFQLGVVREPVRGHERYVGRVAIPYRTGFGEPRGFRFRRLDNGSPKYDGDPGVQSHLFAPKYTAEKLVYVTEGEFDCIILHQIGLRAVGIPGANHFKREWRWMFRHAERVVGVLDGDGDPKAAAAFQTKLSVNLRDIVPVTFAQMPNGHDINTMYLKDRRKLARLLEVK